MKSFWFLCLSFFPVLIFAQNRLSLEEAYLLAERNYPLGKQTELIEKRTASEIDILEKDKLPKLKFETQATYQSDVIKLPSQLPGSDFEPPNKDQYRATIEANQLIYDGGSINASTKLKKAVQLADQQQIIVDLYGLKNLVNQYFFSALLLQEQKNILLSKKELLNESLREVASGVRHGAVLSSNEQIVKAELLKLDQQITQADYDLKKAFEKLSILVVKDIGTNTVLEDPSKVYRPKLVIQRPELKLFDLRQEELEVSKDVISKSLIPKISSFAQVGYGNPGLNMLDNSFQDFYIAGLKMSWNIFDWGIAGKKKETIDFSKKMISSQKESFLVNNRMEEKDAEHDIEKYEAMLRADDGIIDMRENILKTVTSQLKYGTITSSDYIRELDNLYEAKINRQLHKIQLDLSIAKYNVVVGEE